VNASAGVSGDIIGNITVGDCDIAIANRKTCSIISTAVNEEKSIEPNVGRRNEQVTAGAICADFGFILQITLVGIVISSINGDAFTDGLSLVCPVAQNADF